MVRENVRAIQEGSAMNQPLPVGLERLRAMLAARSGSGGMLTVALADSLEALIAEGSLPAGSRLPSAQQLARALGVSRPTVHDAYDLLSVQGHIDKRSRIVAGPPG